MSEKFKLLVKYCQYANFGREDGDWVDTCTKKSQIPDGHSWGYCKEKSCPFLRELSKVK